MYFYFSLRYSIEYVPLAVHELEDRELGRFSFRSRDDMMKVKYKDYMYVVTLSINFVVKRVIYNLGCGHPR